MQYPLNRLNGCMYFLALWKKSTFSVNIDSESHREPLQVNFKKKYLNFAENPRKIKWEKIGNICAFTVKKSLII